MSNRENLPVYSVPGTGETPTTMYYLRSFSSLPDTEITEDQFNGITDYIDSVTEGTQHDILAGHAAADPASPDFVAPAVNADVAGSAAAPISQPVQTPPVGEDAPLDPAASPNGDGNFTQPEDSTPPVINPGIVISDTPITDQPEGPVVEGGEAPTPVADQPASTGEATESDPGAVLPGSDASTSGAEQGGSPDAGSPAGGDQAQPDAGTAEADPTSGDGAADSGVPAEDPATEAPAQPVTEGETPVVDQSGSEPDPNGQPETETSATDSGSSTSPVSDPTNPEVVAGEPLPSSVTDNPGTLDPTTGEAPDLTDHPVDSAALPDPTIVQPPPPDVDPVSWFAKEKQRIIDLLRAESDRVSGLTEPEA